MRIKINPDNGPGKFLAPFSHTINAIPKPIAQSSGGLTTIAGTAMTAAGSGVLKLEVPAPLKGIDRELFNLYRQLGSQSIADFSQQNPIMGGLSNCVIGCGLIGFGDQIGDFYGDDSDEERPKSPS